MPKSVIYTGKADRREVTRADLEKAGIKSFADSFKDFVFLRQVPQEVNNDYAEALVDSGLFVNFEHASGDEEAPAQQATDKSVQEAGGTPGGSDSTSTTGTASTTTSGTTGSGTTAASTSRASR